MLSIVILICAPNIERSDCTLQTAQAVLRPAATISATGCGMEAQAAVATTLQLRQGEYMKVRCRRANTHLNEARLPGGKP